MTKERTKEKKETRVIKNKKDIKKFKRTPSGHRRLKKQKALRDLFQNEQSRTESLPNQPRFQNNATFLVSHSIFDQKNNRSSPKKEELKGLTRKNDYQKDVQKIFSKENSRRSSRAEEMVSRNSEANSRGRSKGIPENKSSTRRKPHSLPPLPRTPKSPIQKTETTEAQNIRRLIGSPPPTGLLKRSSSGSLDIVNISKEHWRTDSARSGTPFPEEEHTVYSPNSFLESSQPKITLKMAPKAGISEEDELPDDRLIVKTASSTRSLDSISSLIQSTKSLNLNSSLTLPPRLLSYQNEDGSTAVQEWVPEERLKSAPFRRSSTPSIRDLPTPLQGVSPLEVTPKHHPNSRNSKRKLKPIKKH